MYPRFAFALLFSVCAFGLGIAIPAFPEQKCGSNAEFSHCGSACVPDCANPGFKTPCMMQCIVGCFCKEGFLKNANGECVRPQECDAPTQPKIPMQKPGSMPTCPDNEEFQACGSACAPTCANPSPSDMCTKNCVVGCFCKQGHLRNSLGVCVPAHQCEAPETFMMLPPVPKCGDHEMLISEKDCGSQLDCMATCGTPLPFMVHGYPQVPKKCQDTKCAASCVCQHPYVRNAAGQCVERKDCETTANQKTMLFAYPPEVSQCKDNEIFLPCGSACAPTCANPHPGSMCTKQCVVGCFCKPGFLKNEQGSCVAAENCGASAADAIPIAPQVCSENEEFRSCKGCDGTCDKPNPICPRICVPGCACKKGHVRSGSNGRCIPQEQCPKVNPSSFMMLPPIPKCGDREMLISEKDCGSQLDCMATCGTPLPFMIHGYPQVPKKCQDTKCAAACVCKHPYVRNTAGQCVERKDCEKTTQ